MIDTRPIVKLQTSRFAVDCRPYRPALVLIWAWNYGDKMYSRVVVIGLN